MKSLDTIFQNTLNLRLSLLEKVKIDKFRRSKIEDSYNLEHIIQKAVELISEKNITQALKQTSIIMLQKTRVDPDLRVPVIFFKKETVQKVKLSPDIKSLQQEMSILKTMYKKVGKSISKQYKTSQTI